MLSSNKRTRVPPTLGSRNQQGIVNAAGEKGRDHSASKIDRRTESRRAHPPGTSHSVCDHRRIDTTRGNALRHGPQGTVAPGPASRPLSHRPRPTLHQPRIETGFRTSLDHSAWQACPPSENQACGLRKKNTRPPPPGGARIALRRISQGTHRP